MVSISSLHAKERNYAIGSFENIQLEGDIIVNIITNKSPSASAIGNNRQLSDIKFSRNGRTLKIQLVSGSTKKRSKNLREHPLTIFVSTHSLKNISIRGNGTINVDHLKSRNSNFIISGSGVISIKDADIDDFKITINGGGYVNFKNGSARKSEFTINGFGSINASQFTTEILEIEHQGPANTTIIVTKVANIINNGAGRIEVLGEANCIIKTIGSGVILCDNSTIEDN